MRQIIKQLASLGLFGDINAALKYELRSRIRQLGREGKIKTVYDIGAHHGNWSRGMKRLLPKANFFLFEANPSCRSSLQKTGFPFVLEGLGRNKGRRIFYTANSTGDSFYRQNEGLCDFSGWKEMELEVTDLDSCVKQQGFRGADWIKLDVQGAELDILAGGHNAFTQASFVLCEVPVAPYNIGAPNFSDYLDAFGAAGFRPTQLVEMHKMKTPGSEAPTLIQLDLFLERL